MGPAAEHDTRARGFRALDESVDPLEMLAGDQRPEVGRLLARVPLADRGGGVREPLEEVVVDRTLDQEPRPGETHLAGVVELVHRLRDAASRSASAKITNGDFPPSSSDAA